MTAHDPLPAGPGKSVRTDADRREDAELFLAQWPGGKRLTAEDRGDFIAGWTGWHAGIDFDHECDVRDRLAAASKPAQVATIKELNALPDGAVVVDAIDFAWQRNGHIDCVPMWDMASESERKTSSEIPLPAVVVWMPTAGAGA